jgi:iron complex outermembrane recepter protein
MTKSTLQACAGRTALALAILLGAATQAPALAQEVTSAQMADADEDVIMVTARRRAENQQDVPIAITAVSSETLEDLRVTEATDLEGLEPTFSVSPASGYVNRPVYGLRGIRPTEAIYGQDPTVAIYFAEAVQSPAQGSNLGFYDLENVQILKGPQGTLFGRNTVGGAILLTPRRPRGEFGVDAMVGFGQDGLFETELGIDIPVAPTFNVRLAGRTIDSDGYQTNVGTGPFNGTKYGGEKTRSVRATVVGNLNDRIENTIIVTYDDKDSNGRIGQLQAINPANALVAGYNAVTGGRLNAALARAQSRDINEVETDIENYDDVEAWSITNSTVAELSDTLTFKSILNYREVDTRTSLDIDSTIEPILHSTPQVSNLDHHSVELQLQGDFDRLDWVVGGFYYHEQGDEFSPGIFYPALLAAINPIRQGANANNTSYSVFAQGSYEFNDQLTLTLGGRMNWDRKRLTLLSKNGNTCALQVFNTATPAPNDLIRLPNNACALPLEENFSQPTGTASIDYKINPDVLVYATSRLGYRSGGFNLRADVPVEYEPFQAETVIDVEAGVKASYDVGAMRMRTNVAVYNQWYDDIQRTVAVENFGGTPGSAVQNAAKATVFGVEVNQMIQPFEPLTFDISYSYVKPEYKSYLDPFTNVDLSSTPFPFTPEHSVSIRGTYEQQLGTLGEFRFTANAAWQDEMWINSLHTSAIIAAHPVAILPLLKQESYWLVDISAGLNDIAGTGIDVQGYIRNLFDEEYKIGGVQLYTGATGTINAVYGRPRQAGVQVRYSF